MPRSRHTEFIRLVHRIFPVNSSLNNMCGVGFTDMPDESGTANRIKSGVPKSYVALRGLFVGGVGRGSAHCCAMLRTHRYDMPPSGLVGITAPPSCTGFAVYIALLACEITHPPTLDSPCMSPFWLGGYLQDSIDNLCSH